MACNCAKCQRDRQRWDEALREAQRIRREAEIEATIERMRREREGVKPYCPYGGE